MWCYLAGQVAKYEPKKMTGDQIWTNFFNALEA
jgi:hypothetical protein